MTPEKTANALPSPASGQAIPGGHQWVPREKWGPFLVTGCPPNPQGTFQTCFFPWGTGLHVSSPATSSH